MVYGSASAWVGGLKEPDARKTASILGDEDEDARRIGSDALAKRTRSDLMESYGLGWSGLGWYDMGGIFSFLLLLFRRTS